MKSDTRGENNPFSKITAKQANAIRRSYLGGMPIDDICSRQGVSASVVADIISGRSWAHLLNDQLRMSLKAEARKRRRSNIHLSDEDVREIRRQLANGATGRMLATQFGVHFGTISDIKCGKTWR